MTEAFIYNHGTKNAKVTNPEETEQILEEINFEFTKDNGVRQYAHQVIPRKIYNIIEFRLE